MASAIANLFRLARAGFVFAQYGVRLVPKGHKVPLVLRIGQIATWPVRICLLYTSDAADDLSSGEIAGVGG